LPPKSYIHVEDFKNPKELVEYLQYLDSNATAYAEYLEWRNLARFFKESDSIDLNSPVVLNEATENELKILKVFGKPEACGEACGFCGLCRKLHQNETKVQRVQNIGLMLKDDRPECFNNNLNNKIMNL